MPKVAYPSLERYVPDVTGVQTLTVHRGQTTDFSSLGKKASVPGSSARRAQVVVLLGIAITVLTVLRALVLAGDVLARFLNADVLYSVTVYRDLFVDHLPMRGWSFAAAPSFFPDLSVVAAALLLTRDVGLGLTLWVVSLILLLGLGFAGILRGMGTARAPAFVYGFASILTVIALIPTGTGILTEFVLPCHHSGSLLMGTAILAVFLRVLGGASIRCPAVIFFIGAVATLSDKAVVAQFIVPLLVVAAVLGATRLIPWRTAFVATVALVSGWVLGAAALDMLLARHLIRGANLPFYLTENLRLPARAAWPRFAWLARESWPFPVLLGAWLLVCGGIVVRSAARRLRPEWRATDARCDVPLLTLAIFSLVSTATIVVPILIIPPEDYWATRHLAPLYAMPVVGLLGCLALNQERTSLRWIGSFLLLILAAFTAMRTIPGVHGLYATGLGSPYPDRVRAFDEVVARQHLHHGYSDYWNAKIASVLSRTGVRVNSVTPNLEPLVLVSNPAWFSARGDGGPGYPRYDFIMTARLSPDRILARFGPPRVREATPLGEVWVYDRPSDIEFRNFLRSSVAPAKGGFVVTDAARPRLASIERDGVPANVNGTLPVPDGAGVTAQFQCEEGCDVAELSGDAADEYALEVQVAGEPVRWLESPRVAASGLKTRFLRLSPPVRGRLAVTVTTVGPPGAHRLGHLVLYRDPPAA